MYTSEFIEKVEALPFVREVDKNSHNNQLTMYRKAGEDVMAIVGTDAMYVIDTNWHGFNNLHNDGRVHLMSIIWRYISTPVDEREPEKRFELKPKSEFKTLFGDDKLRLPIFGGIIIRFTNSELKDLFTEQQLDWIEMTFDKEWIDE